MLKVFSRLRLIIFNNLLYRVHYFRHKQTHLKCAIPIINLFKTHVTTGVFAFIPMAHCARTSCNKESKNMEDKVSQSICQSDDLFKVGKFEESYNVLKQFEELENHEILWRLARSLYNMAKEKKVKNSEKEEMIKHAFELINKALLLNDKSSAVHKWMAILLDAKCTLEGTKARIQALPDFKKHLMNAMELGPKDATTIYILGQYCFNIASMPWYQRKIAAALFATPPEATFEEALEYFTKAEEVEPNFYSLNLLMLGKTYLQLKKIDAARYWLKCASTYPIRTEEDKEVRKEAEELLKKNPPAKTEGSSSSSD